MNRSARNGAGTVAQVLEVLGTRHVFGFPGTRIAPLFEGLRTSGIRTVVPTSELAAAFMAGAYHRAGGGVGVLFTMPGPGFVLSLPGLAEAQSDSAAILHVTALPPDGPGRNFNLQAVDQRRMAEPVVKAVHDVREAEAISDTLAEAYRTALDGEPGPVVVQLSDESMRGPAPALDPARVLALAAARQLPDVPAVEEAVRRLCAAERVALFVGQGCLDDAARVQLLAEQLNAPVLTTPSGRGVIPEDHLLAVGVASGRAGAVVANELFEAADLVLVLGAKLSHNGTVGMALRFPAARTIHVDAAAHVLGANYAVALAVTSPVGHLLDVWEGRGIAGREAPGAWTRDDVRTIRRRLRSAQASGPEPRLHGARPSTAEGFFRDLRNSLPRDAIVVTDSGLHQILTRQYYRVLHPRGLLIPSDFQSMGFGIPAALAAWLACPTRRVVAIVGDGGFAMSGFEMATMVRERVPVTVIVFADHALGEIRMRQLADYGAAYGVSVAPLNLRRVGGLLGVEYACYGDRDFSFAWRGTTPRLVEVRLSDSPEVVRTRTVAVGKRILRKILPGRAWHWVKRWLKPGARSRVIPARVEHHGVGSGA